MLAVYSTVESGQIIQKKVALHLLNTETGIEQKKNDIFLSEEVMLDYLKDKIDLESRCIIKILDNAAR